MLGDPGEFEVTRSIPEVGKCYKMTNWTIKYLSQDYSLEIYSLQL